MSSLRVTNDQLLADVGIMKAIIKTLKTLFFPLKTRENDYKVQSFTYFIPSPPMRSSGYREKQFDKLFYEFINRGYRLLELKTTAVSSGEKQSGMWVLCIVQATNEMAEKLNLEEVLHEQLKDKHQTKESVEGLYYIDDRANEL